MNRVALLSLALIGCASVPEEHPECGRLVLAIGSQGPMVLVTTGAQCDSPQAEVTRLLVRSQEWKNGRFHVEGAEESGAHVELDFVPAVADLPIPRGPGQLRLRKGKRLIATNHASLTALD